MRWNLILILLGFTLNFIRTVTILEISNKTIETLPRTVIMDDQSSYLIQQIKSMDIPICLRPGHEEKVSLLCADNRCQKGRLLEPLCSQCLKDPACHHLKENHLCLPFTQSLLQLIQSINNNKDQKIEKRGTSFFGNGINDEEKSLEGLIKWIDRQCEILKSLRSQMSNFSKIYAKKKNSSNIQQFVFPLIEQILESSNHQELKINVFELMLISEVKSQQILIDRDAVYEHSKNIQKDCANFIVRIKKSLEILDRDFTDIRQLQEKELMAYTTSRAIEVFNSFISPSIKSGPSSIADESLTQVLQQQREIIAFQQTEIQQLKEIILNLNSAYDKLSQQSHEENRNQAQSQPQGDYTLIQQQNIALAQKVEQYNNELIELREQNQVLVEKNEQKKQLIQQLGSQNEKEHEVVYSQVRETNEQFQLFVLEAQRILQEKDDYIETIEQQRLSLYLKLNRSSHEMSYSPQANI